MGTLQENQSLNAEYERNKKEREMREEIERLKELCDKYEEEHKTTFEIWQKDIKENEHLRTALNNKENIIKEAREYIKWHYDLATDENVEFCLLRDRLLEILDKVEEEQ